MMTNHYWVKSAAGCDVGHDLSPLSLLPGGTIFLGWRGSVAHGTYIPPSEPDAIDDIDVIGVVIPEPRYYFGLQEWGSRGTKEIKRGHVDAVFYELRKMINLLLQGNPNVLSALWLPSDLIIQASPEWCSLRDNRQWFVGKHVFDAFYGYAQSQLKKMFATEGAFEGYMGDKRKQLVKKFGYDTKNAAHLVRLLRMGIEFIGDGELRVVRPDAVELLAIKRGTIPLATIRGQVEELFEQFKDADKRSSLPAGPNYEAVEAWLVETIQRRCAERSFAERMAKLDDGADCSAGRLEKDS